MFIKLFSAWAAIFALTSCTKSSVTVYLHDPLDPSQFTGLKRVADNGNGTYQLTWEALPSNLKIASKAKYGVFSREVPPASLWGKFLNLFSSSNEYSFTAPLATVDYKIGNYTTPILAFKHNTCFVIRVIGASEFKDVNKVELCTRHVKFSFAGAKALTANGDNSYNVSWDALPYVTSFYHIFTRDEVSGRYNFSEPTVVNGVTAWQSGVLTYKPSQCFVVRAVPVNAEFVDTNINELCTGHHQSFYAGISSLTSLGGGSYKLEWAASTLENTSYKIFERSVLGQYDAQVSMATSSELSYTKTNVTGNYCYLVRAVSETSSFIDNNLKEICINPQVYGDFAGITNSEVVGSDVKLNVAWATGASAMRVLRDGTVINEQTSTQNFSYTDTNAAGATEHLYQAQAVIGGETLAGTAAHTISNANVGDFIGCSSVAALSDTQIQVNYVWPVIDGRTVSAITIYRNGILVSTQVSPSISKYVDSGFTAQESARYTCKVIIDDVELTGKQSLAAVTTTAAPTPIPVPPDVNSLGASNVSTSIISLAWISGGGSTANYKVSYASGAIAPATCAAGTLLPANQIIGSSVSEGSSYGANVTGLTPDTQYSFRVCAVNGNDTPDESGGVSVTKVTLQLPPPNVTGLLSIPSSNSVIGLTWTSGGGSTVNYTVSYIDGATPPVDCTTGTVLPSNQISGTTVSYGATVTGLTANTQYSFRVCAINANATPDISSGATTNNTTLQAAPPNVTVLTATATSDTVISLNWTSAGGSTVDYRIKYASGATAPANCNDGTTVSGSPINITSLASDTQYSFIVCAANGNVTPDVSSGVSVAKTTLQAFPPNVTNLTTSLSSATSILLSWTAGGGSTVGYRVSYSAGATAPASCSLGTVLPSNQISGVSASVADLTANTQYSFLVCALNGNTTPDMSSGTSITTVTSVDPPTAFSATPTTSSAAVSWTAPANSSGWLDHYDVAIGTSSGGTQIKNWTNVGNLTSSTISSISLSFGVTYYFSVRSVNNIGLNSSSVIVTGALVDSTAPTTPTSIIANTTLGASNISPTATWTASMDAGGSGIAYYEMAIGTTTGGTNIANWTNVGSATSGYITGLSLAAGTTYYTSVRAVDGNGNVSSPGNGDSGWVSLDPYWSSVSLLAHMNGTSGSTTFTNAQAGITMTAESGQASISTATKKFGTGSAYLIGTGSSALGLSTNALLTLSGDFTVEFWFNAPTSTTGTIIGGLYPGNMHQVKVQAGGTQDIGMYGSGSTWRNSSAAVTISLNAWHHVAITRSGTTMRFYYDGNKVGNDLTGINDTFNFSGGSIGALRTYGSGYFNGYMDEVRITKGVARYTDTTIPLNSYGMHEYPEATIVSDSTPPTAPGSFASLSSQGGYFSSPSTTWTPSTDASGIDHYEMAVGSLPLASDISGWVSVGNVTTATISGLTMVAGGTYYSSVRAVDTVGNISAIVNENTGWTVPVDSTPPSTPGAFTGSLITNELVGAWTAATDTGGCGVAYYQLALGSISGGTDIAPWTSVGNGVTGSLTGLTLTPGNTYYASIRAVDYQGNISTSVNALGWLPLTRLPFTYTAANQSFVVPAGITSITVKMWGGGGAGGAIGWGTSGIWTGGGGGFSLATIPVTPGETLTAVVGGGGVWNGMSNTYGGAGRGFGASSGWAGSGGGMSAIKRGTTYLLIAGGGGAGGAPAAAGSGSNGGAGGGATGETAPNMITAAGPGWGGGGGTQSAGGASGGGDWSPNAGTQYTGGNANSEGGGGGGGYYGGGAGGGIGSHGFCGSGGGSGYSAAGNYATSLIVGSARNPANISDPDFISSISYGGDIGGNASSPASGKPGYLIIFY